MPDMATPCDIVESHLPLKKRRFNTTIEDAPLDYSLPSRERAKLLTSSRACSSSPCSSKSSMVSDVEMDEDQRVPSDPKRISNASSQILPIDLSVRSHREPSEICRTPAIKLTTRQKQLPLTPSLLLGCFTVPNAVDIFGALSLLDQNLYLPSASSLRSPVRKLNLASIKVAKADDDQSTKDDGNGYVINPTTGNRCKKNYKNVTVEKRCEANARERTRVQTIAATFEELRGLLPCDDDTKLSKLAILRIASKYIQYLAALIGKDYSGKGFGIEKCLQILNETMESESHIRR
ncbi:Protein atonal -like protein 8 [Toxocara canis]|uniref:Protein atonal-like protein 8 n=1 Tax=Toxocara canis TaxID=6265 RepID=A0A0B2UTV0_TOXCA|nr:Protein atonal -like protein 8 [Toxocara canis]